MGLDAVTMSYKPHNTYNQVDKSLVQRRTEGPTIVVGIERAPDGSPSGVSIPQGGHASRDVPSHRQGDIQGYDSMINNPLNNGTPRDNVDHQATTKQHAHIAHKLPTWNRCKRET